MTAVRVRFRNVFTWLGLGSSPERAQFAAAVGRVLSERYEELNSAELHALTRVWSDLELYGRLASAADAGAVPLPSGFGVLPSAAAFGVFICRVFSIATG